MAVGSERWRLAGLVLASSALFVGLLCLLARVTALPFIFPALGASAFLLVSAPTAPTSSPKNAVLGYALAIVCGYLPLLALGLQDAPQDLPGHLTAARTIALALALGLTGVAMVLTDLVHPPASAATVMIALGMITRPLHLATIEGAVIALVAAAAAFNRLAARARPKRT